MEKTRGQMWKDQKKPKVEVDYQGVGSWESAKQRESYIIKEVVNTLREGDDIETIEIVD